LEAVIGGGKSIVMAFQFHFGSIGSIDATNTNSLSNGFQFHFGSIGSLQELKIKEIPDNVSIPLWFDWKNY